MSKTELSREQFILIWNAGDNRHYIANMCGCRLKAVTLRANRIRESGIYMRQYQQPCEAAIQDANRPADKPTPYAPGTWEKIAELARRAELRMELKHNDDATAENAINRTPHAIKLRPINERKRCTTKQ